MSKRKSRGSEVAFQDILDPYLKQLSQWKCSEEVEALFKSLDFVADLKYWRATCFDIDGHAEWLLAEFSVTKTTMFNKDWDKAIETMKTRYLNILDDELSEPPFRPTQWLEKWVYCAHQLFQHHNYFFSEFATSQPRWCYEMCLRILVTVCADLRSRPVNGYFAELLGPVKTSLVHTSTPQVPQKRGSSALTGSSANRLAQHYGSTHGSSSLRQTSNATQNKPTPDKRRTGHSLSSSSPTSEASDTPSSLFAHEPNSSPPSAIDRQTTNTEGRPRSKRGPMSIIVGQPQADEEVERVWRLDFLEEKEKNVKLQAVVNKVEAENRDIRQQLDAAEDGRHAATVELHRLQEKFKAIRNMLDSADFSE